jgi:hypothetical protein
MTHVISDPFFPGETLQVSSELLMHKNDGTWTCPFCGGQQMGNPTLLSGLKDGFETFIFMTDQLQEHYHQDAIKMKEETNEQSIKVPKEASCY